MDKESNENKTKHINDLLNNLEKTKDLLENYKENILVLSADTHTRICCKKCEKIFSFNDEMIWNKKRNEINIIIEEVTWNFYESEKKVILKNIDMDNFECNCSSCD
jgi:hypothetical protein